MDRLKGFTFILVFLVATFALVLAGGAKEKSSKKQPTAFQKRCSVCHSLAEVRVGFEKIIKNMHDRAGVKLSDSSLKDIEETFTLLPTEEPSKGLFQEKCGKCHSLDKVVVAHQTKSEGELKEIILRMAEKHDSGISQKEIDKINQSMMMLNEIYEPDVELKKEDTK